MAWLGPRTATVGTVSGSNATVGIFSPAATVSGRTVFNDAAVTMYLIFGGSASSTSFTATVAATTLYTFSSPPYAGTVACTWNSGTPNVGTARTTQW